MKKKSLTFVLTLLSLSILASCGKSEQKQAQEYYEQELGLDSETASELAEEFYGDDNDADADSKEDSEVNEAEEDGIQLVQPSQEIIDSKITDPIIQIGNAVIHTDKVFTLKEFLDVLESDSGFTDFKCVSHKGKEFTSEGTVKPDETKVCDILVGDKNLITVGLWNNTENTVSPFDTIITFFSLSGNEYGGYTIGGYNELHYNCYYAGNINAGYYNIDDTQFEYHPELLVYYEKLQNNVNVINSSDYSDLEAIAEKINSEGYEAELDPDYGMNYTGGSVDTSYVYWDDKDCVLGTWNGKPVYRRYVLRRSINTDNGDLLYLAIGITSSFMITL